MSERQNKPRIGFLIAAVVIAVILAYPLSFGPACWLLSRVELPNVIWTAMNCFYSPIVQAWGDDDGSTADAIDWYANLGAGKKSVTVIGYDGMNCLATIGDPAP